MNTPNEQKPAVNPAKPGDLTQPNKNSPPANKGDRDPSPASVSQASPDAPTADPTKKPDPSKPAYVPYTPSAPAKDEVKPPMHAAKGNDEVMSQPQKQA